MTSTPFTIDIDRPDDRDESLTATIHYPNNTTHTISTSQYSTDQFMNSLQTLLEAYNPDDDNTPPLETALCNDIEHRAELAIDTLDAYTGCHETRFWELDNEIVAFLSTTNTEPVEELEFICNLTVRATTIEFTREHGIHLRVHWRVNNHGIDYQSFPAFDRDDFIDKFADKEVNTWESIDAVLAKHTEHTSNTDSVVTDTTVSDGPRIAGTDHHALHIAWRIQHLDDPRNDITGTTFDSITDDDIDTALEYADNHPDEYDAYVTEKQQFRDQFKNTDSDTGPLDPEDSLVAIPDEDDITDEIDDAQ